MFSEGLRFDRSHIVEDRNGRGEEEIHFTRNYNFIKKNYKQVQMYKYLCVLVGSQMFYF